MSDPAEPASGKRGFGRLLGHDFFAAHQWRRRIALWSGGIAVGLVAIAFAKGSDLAYRGFRAALALSPWLALLLTPLTFAVLAWITEGRLKSTRGSGIPQVIAALAVEDERFRERVLSLPVALGKVGLTLLGLLGGASIGREGPTVHVGAGIMYWIGRRFGFTDPKALSRFILVGGGAGIAAAFNTPLAGVVFAIEELAGTYEHRFSGIVLTAVIFAGIVSLGVLGDYAYFGRVDAVLPLGESWIAIALCGICGGIGGGLFVRAILLGGAPLARIAALRRRAPVAFAAGCGLALAVGAGMGHTLASLLPSTEASAVVLLGMASFLAGVTQAPITAAVISLELTANQSMVIAIMAVCLIARAMSSLVSPKPVYRAFAERLLEERAKSGLVAEQ